MSISNGIDTGPLAGWVIVVGHVRILGKFREGSEFLRPAYELHVGVGMSPDGRFMTQHQVFPILGFSSQDTWTLPLRGDELMLRVESLSLSERGRLAAAVAQCEQIVKAMRAAESGISLATDMPKIDPKTLLRKP